MSVVRPVIPWAPKTVYHCYNMTAETADHLWNMGFREVDCPDDQGSTPMTYSSIPSHHRFLEYIYWLTTKGGSLGVRTSSKPAHQARHLLAWKLGRIHEPTGDLAELPELQRIAAASILSQCHVDGCRCSCSSKGCVPFKTLLDSAVDAHCIHQTGRCYIRWLENDQTGIEPISADVWCEVLRWMTFELLGLRHTCCRGHRSLTTSDGSQISEIADEQSQLLEVLEDLVADFQAKLLTQNITFTGFFLIYWKDRADKVLLDLSSEESQERARLASLGLKLEHDRPPEYPRCPPYGRVRNLLSLAKRER